MSENEQDPTPLQPPLDEVPSESAADRPADPTDDDVNVDDEDDEEG